MLLPPDCCASLKTTEIKLNSMVLLLKIFITYDEFLLSFLRAFMFLSGTILSLIVVEIEGLLSVY